DASALARLSAIPPFNAQLRTTCVATTLQGGHAANALPQLASAKVNCRILPGEPVAEVKATLVKVLADDQIAVTQIEREVTSEPSKLNEEIVGAIDGAFLRNAGIPTYGHSGMAMEAGDSSRVHGRDERVRMKSFYDGDEYLYRLVRALAGGV